MPFQTPACRMQNPDILPGSKLKVIPSADEHRIVIPGYRILFTLSGLLWIGPALFILGGLIKTAEETHALVVSGSFLLLLVVTVFLLHSPTILYFGKERIRVRYGWLPFARSRKTSALTKVHIEYSTTGTSTDGLTGNFTCLILTFSKGWDISIIIEHLSIRERDFLTGRLSYLRYKYGAGEPSGIRPK